VRRRPWAARKRFTAERTEATEESFGLFSANSVSSVVSVLFWVVTLPGRVTLMSDYGKLLKSRREPHLTIPRWFYEKG
jgi:hypothetical protein